MAKGQRYDEIVRIINENGYVSVTELSQRLHVSEMTIRRDLAYLDDENRIQRTFGGAAPRRSDGLGAEDVLPEQALSEKLEGTQVDQMDVLIATSVDPYYDRLLLNRVGRKNIPIIAESIEMPNQLTLVAVDNYQAGLDLGHWVGEYFSEKRIEKVNLLDLTFHQSNTQNRSHGFIDGLREKFPSSELILSINAQSRYTTAYRLAYDALTVYPQINLIFAINDTTAWGAINACRDLKIDPQNMTVIPFGLEGDTLKNELISNSYTKAGLAMFPEIVSLICIEAAIEAYNHQPLPERYVTPHVVLTGETLSEYYTKRDSKWELNWESTCRKLKIPTEIEREKVDSLTSMPRKIGLIVPFLEHEWYQTMTVSLKAYAEEYGIGLYPIDAEQNVRDEIDFRRHQIARKAASLVEAGNVVLVDGGPIANYLAQELKQKPGITVITNSVDVFDTLNRTQGITLISTGGAVRYSTQVLVGLIAEGALRELRADKLFLMVNGITVEFGLCHDTISEVSIKQAMIRSAREVILLADHTAFGADTGVQVAPLRTVNLLITDDALPPSTRLEISKMGIPILLV